MAKGGIDFGGGFGVSFDYDKVRYTDINTKYYDGDGRVVASTIEDSDGKIYGLNTYEYRDDSDFISKTNSYEYSPVTSEFTRVERSFEGISDDAISVKTSVYEADAFGVKEAVEKESIVVAIGDGDFIEMTKDEYEQYCETGEINGEEIDINTDGDVYALDNFENLSPLEDTPDEEFGLDRLDGPDEFDDSDDFENDKLDTDDIDYNSDGGDY